MTEPVIARRCPSCGVSIREVAFFCPQCGENLPKKQADSPTEAASQATQPLFRDTIALDAPDARVARETGNEDRKEDRKVGQAALGAVGAKIQRATTLARDVEGNVIHRVQKAREISSVVIDEAGYDPSLRFVLVAAILFFLFLVIVLLNKLIS